MSSNVWDYIFDRIRRDGGNYDKMRHRLATARRFAEFCGWMEPTFELCVEFMNRDVRDRGVQGASRVIYDVSFIMRVANIQRRLVAMVIHLNWDFRRVVDELGARLDGFPFLYFVLFFVANMKQTEIVHVTKDEFDPDAGRFRGTDYGHKFREIVKRLYPEMPYKVFANEAGTRLRKKDTIAPLARMCTRIGLDYSKLQHIRRTKRDLRGRKVMLP